MSGHPTLRRWRIRLERARSRATFVAVRLLLRWAGFGRARRLGEGAGELQFALAWRTRRRIERDMAIALARPAADAALRATLRAAYRNADAAVFEILALFDRQQSEASLRGLADIDGIDRLREALGAGRGAILLGSHSGNSALVVIALAAMGYATSVVYREARMRDQGFFQHGLERYGIQGIVANQGLKAYGQILSALRQGRVVFMMIDQGTRKPADGVVRRFLGKDMAMPGGPAQIAKVMRAPVLPLRAVAAQPRWSFVIEPPLPLTYASIETDLDLLFDTIERHVRSHPELWTWHHRRWRDVAVAAAADATPP